MSDLNKLVDNQESVKDNFEEELKIKLLKEALSKSFQEYKTTIAYMSADAPISVLCLDKATENILNENGLERIYDLFDYDFTKIKGLGVGRIRNLTSRLNEFFSVL